MREPDFIFLQQPPSRAEVVKRWLLRAVVALAFIVTGEGKFESHSQWIEIFQRIGLGQWFRYFTGVLQVVGGLLVLIPRMAGLGFLLLSSTMLGAMASWTFLLGVPPAAIIPGAILGGLLFVGGEDVMDLAARCRNFLTR